MFSESDGYERFMGRWSRRLAPLFVDFAGVEAGNVVLDVGSRHWRADIRRAPSRQYERSASTRRAIRAGRPTGRARRPGALPGRRRFGAALPGRVFRPGRCRCWC